VEDLDELPPGAKAAAYEQQRVRDPEGFFEMVRELEEDEALFQRYIEELSIPLEDRERIDEVLESITTKRRELVRKLVDQVA
jgi:hypothetical protein